MNEMPDVLSHLNILYSVTLALKSKIVVELGTGFGLATKTFSDACLLTGGKVYTIDIQDKFQVPSAKHSLHDRDNVEFILSDSIEAGKKWDKGNIDILFADSDHGYQHVLDELMTWEKHKPKIIFIHDTLTTDGQITPAFHAAKNYAVARNKRFVNFILPRGLGMII